MRKYIDKIKKDPIINLLIPHLKNHRAYLVGGFVRDVLMEKESVDRDLIIIEDELELFAKDLADKIDAYFIELDSVNSIYRLVMEDKINYIDITKPIENNLLSLVESYRNFEDIVAEEMVELGIDKKDLPKLISKLEKDMHKAAKILDFERAAEIRDQLKKLREMVNS